MIANDLLRAEGDRIIQLLQTDFLLPSGALSLQRIQGNLDQRTSLSDLGDIVPFLLYFQGHDLAVRQIEAARSIAPDGLLLSETPTHGVRGFYKSYEYTDYILGLLAYYDYSRQPTDKNYLTQTIDTAVTLFRFNHNWISYNHRGWPWQLPIRDYRDGMFVELLAQATVVLEQPSYLQLAQAFSDQLVADSQWKRWGIWPSFSFGGRAYHLWSRLFPRLRRFELVKANSNTIFGLLQLYRQAPKQSLRIAIETSLSAISENFTTPEGKVWSQFEPGIGASKETVTAAFTLIEMLCDASVVLRQPSYVGVARRIADYWLLQQSNLGLFPLSPGRSKSFVDSNTDMIVALYKLAELSMETRYRQAADRCLDGMVTTFGRHNYPLHLDVTTGEVVNNVIKSKFLALFLKAIILKLEFDDGHTIYQTPTLFELLKDR